MLKPEHTIIINGFVARVRATQFSSTTQLKLFYDTLMEQLGITSGKFADEKLAKANLRALNAVARKAFKARVRTAWCKKNLQVGDQVRVFGSQTICVVDQLGLDTDLFEVKLRGGKTPVHHQFADITKVLRGSMWVDIFKAAEGIA